MVCREIRMLSLAAAAGLPAPVPANFVFTLLG